ncbi:MAG: amidohydrolase [Gemmatimonadota bacterium]|nr:amidohydrolase [Gemmatimonadota bacterium]
MRSRVVVGVLAMMSSAACSRAADVVLANGVIWTGTGAVASAIAVKAGRIVALGAGPAVDQWVGPRTERIDLGGRVVLPGFMDSHTHFIDGGFELAGVQLRDAATPEEFTRRIAAFAGQHPGGWVTGGTWDHERWGGQLPHRSWIDSVTGETPVFVSRLDGHMGLANSRALALAGVTAATRDPAGGTIVRDAAGEPTGVLKDEAMGLVWRIIPARSELELDRALDAAARYAVERGVTHVTDMGSWAGLETYRRAAAAGRLPLRVYAAVPIATWDRMAAYVERHGRGDARLAWGAVKGFVDGSLGSTTAWFYESYADAPETSGLMVTDTAALRAQIADAHGAGLQVVIHAIGDRANDWVLDAFAAARTLHPDPDPRFRVEHAQHLTSAAIARFARDGVIASMQPYHVIDDGRWAEKRIGPERLRTTYAFRDLIDAGVTVAFGSDWTVAPLEPLYGLYAAVTRRTLDGVHPDGWVPAQRITVAEALTAYTRSAAYAAFHENDWGTLEIGKLADLVVLDADPRAIPPERIEGLRVDLTMVDGRVVYRRRGT